MPTVTTKHSRAPHKREPVIARRRFLGVIVAMVGWVVGLLNVVSGAPASVLFPLAIGIAIATRLVDGYPFWKRAVFWSGIALAFQAATAALVIAALLLFSSQSRAELDPPAVPPDATVIEEWVDPSREGLVQRGILVSAPSSEDEQVRTFYDEAHAHSMGWTPLQGLNSGDWCWVRSGDGDQWQATVLARAADAGEYAVTSVRIGSEFLRMPTSPGTAECAILVGSVAAAV